MNCNTYLSMQYYLTKETMKIFKTHAFLVIVLHCFCRSYETEKNLTHFFDFGVGASITTTINQRRFEDLHRFFCSIMLHR